MHATFSGAGKGEYEVYANNERNMGARGREKRECVLGGKKKGKEKNGCGFIRFVVFCDRRR